MSTPQDTPGTGQGEGQGWNPPTTNGSGQNPAGPYGGTQGQSGQQGQDGYQAAQPSGYAYPGGGAVPQQADKGPAPKEVTRAYYLILAAGILYLVSSIISSLTTEMPDVAGAGVGVAVGLVFAVVFTAIYVVLAIFIRRGQNWARITATVLAALDVLAVSATLLLMPLVSQAAEAGGQAVPPTSGLATALSVIVMLLGVAGVVMTWLKPARPYFAPQKLGY
ncbi:hypothetical protein [Arthrobacter sp. MDT1-65]